MLVNIVNIERLIADLPYIAPEVLQGKPLTEAADIYSFGMIMWTISAGVLPWCNRTHDSQLFNEITSGEIRTPKVYTHLMTRCWDDDPSSRPNTSELYGELETWTVIFKSWINPMEGKNIHLSEEIVGDDHCAF
ncbi:7549_t:CDS:2, partial [Funneliformis geosporum]